MNPAELEIARLNGLIAERNASGDELTSTFNGRPDLRVLSFSPLQLERYGLFRNRGPQLMGEFTARSLITFPGREEGAVRTALAFADSPNTGYAKFIKNAAALNEIGAVITDDPSYEYFERSGPDTTS
jgi:hypothetical protein